MKTVLIYVLSARMDPYDKLLDASLQTWDRVPLEGTETIYYCGNGPRKSHNRIVYFNCNESYNGMAAKNIPAFEWALANRKWDYMARINSSCYVNKMKLLEEIQTLKDTGVFRGVGCGDHANLKFMWGGAQFVFSRDVIEEMIRNRHKCDVTLMDDISLSKWVKDVGFTWDYMGRACSINRIGNRWLCIWYADGKQGGFEFSHFSEMRKAERQFFIRVKQDLKRHEDVQIMKELSLYGI